MVRGRVGAEFDLPTSDDATFRVSRFTDGGPARRTLICIPGYGATGQSFARLRPLGTVIAIGSAAGAWQEIEPARLVGRNVGLAGFYLGRLMRLEPALVSEAVGELLGLWQGGALRPLVGAEVPLDEVEWAHRLVESRQSVGKVVLLP